MPGFAGTLFRDAALACLVRQHVNWRGTRQGSTASSILRNCCEGGIARLQGTDGGAGRSSQHHMEAPWEALMFPVLPGPASRVLDVIRC